MSHFIDILNIKEKIFILNNLIHATSFIIDAVGSRKYQTNLEWWDGDVTISGKLPGGKKKWKFFFDVSSWLSSALSFLNLHEQRIIALQNESNDIIRCN